MIILQHKFHYSNAKIENMQMVISKVTENNEIYQ